MYVYMYVYLYIHAGNIQKTTSECVLPLALAGQALPGRAEAVAAAASADFGTQVEVTRETPASVSLNASSTGLRVIARLLGNALVIVVFGLVYQFGLKYLCQEGPNRVRTRDCAGLQRRQNHAGKRLSF